ncbi:uncharacterized protein LOC113282026 isoform X5 [Papaver somniferum]|uniref:uncharacterized protein LOC113282026 isoform X5 n=1 Tax=Papaver somniferum TaxID=3469 RepID=UPI000E6F9C6A|nr:uncharacterized protein LOC113282026 isoform X5 [Papaver somniferum]XP_026386737.1 uncharacterized protein LOC113282026 isoform X5 [Papaver somniferum]XP_026386738.1 uncharacterized protein LOC113282026 isoform X5 [Papaver somniferum]XP_026386739.1 uncharacterized protein LOC113282026 isoform X5 [Papaver somniferum]
MNSSVGTSDSVIRPVQGLLKYRYILKTEVWYVVSGALESQVLQHVFQPGKTNYLLQFLLGSERSFGDVLTFLDRSYMPRLHMKILSLCFEFLTSLSSLSYLSVSYKNSLLRR